MQVRYEAIFLRRTAVDAWLDCVHARDKPPGTPARPSGRGAACSACMAVVTDQDRHSSAI